MFTFIANLFSILYKVPSAIGIIKMVLDIVGSETVQAILETIRDVVQRYQREQPVGTPIDDLPPPERKRLVDRLKLRLGQKLLGLSDYQLAQTMQDCNRLSELQNA